MATRLGKRYECTACGAELICTKPGDGRLVCCGNEMVIKQAKPLPTSN